MSLSTSSLDRLARDFEPSRRQQIARPPMCEPQARSQNQCLYKCKYQCPNNMQSQVQTKSKQMTPREAVQAEAARHQRTLLRLFQIYAVLVISLALIYAVYHFCQQSSRANRDPSQPHSQPKQSVERLDMIEPIESDAEARAASEPQVSSATMRQQQELEQKIQLMQKYVELLAIDLQTTKDRLSEREKCQCSQACKFNNTTYNEGSRWQQQCDTCTCQSGRISCSPIVCPKLNCDDPIQIAGQCCPVCPKRCKYNLITIRHNQLFKPSDSSKQCICLDGLIKCSARQSGKPKSEQKTSGKTLQVPTSRSEPQISRIFGSSAGNQTTGSQYPHRLRSQNVGKL